TGFPSALSCWSRCPRFEACSSSAKCGECGNPVSAETPFTEELKISFDHCAGRASCNASALSPPAAIRSAASFTIAYGVSLGSNGPIQVAVSSSYCTCVSLWRVPLMNVVPRITCPLVCSAIISSLPKPFCAESTAPRSNLCPIGAIDSSTCVALVATIPKPHSGNSSGSVVAFSETWKSCLPDTLNPSLFSARACSARRTNAHTSTTRARCAAYKLPMAPHPTTQTRFIHGCRDDLLPVLGCRSRSHYFHQPVSLANFLLHNRAEKTVGVVE